MALVVRDGVLWAVAKGFQNVVIEGDSLQIVGGYEDTEYWLSTIIEDVCTHVRHQGNTLAHRFTRYSLNIGSSCEWLDSLPTFIVDLFLEDLL
ncbi:hypothetical protein ACFX1Q_008768 [Malus domestica]